MVNGDRSSARVFLALIRYPALYCTYRYLELTRLLGYHLPTYKQLAESLGAHSDTMGTHLRVLRKLGLLRQVKRRMIMVTEFDRWTIGVLELLTKNQAVIDLEHESTAVLESGLELEWQRGHRAVVGVAAIQPVSMEDVLTPLVPSDSEAVNETDHAAEAAEGFRVTQGFDLDLITTVQGQDRSTQKPPSPMRLGQLVNANQNLPPAAAPGGRPEKPITDEMRAVYDGWATATNTRKVPLKPGPTATRFRCRLAEGFSIADLILVAEWAAQDPWMSGNDPKTRLRICPRKRCTATRIACTTICARRRSGLRRGVRRPGVCSIGGKSGSRPTPRKWGKIRSGRAPVWFRCFAAVAPP